MKRGHEAPVAISSGEGLVVPAYLRRHAGDPRALAGTERLNAGSTDLEAGPAHGLVDGLGLGPVLDLPLRRGSSLLRSAG